MKKWADLQSSTRALVIVIFFGALGALLACWWNLSIGEKEFASGVAALDWALRVLLGSFGAVATVFVVAKTDTTKTIHCGVIAALAGMAGPYLVIKALSTVVNVNPNLVQISSGIGIVQSTTTKLQSTIQSPTGTNPENLVDAFEQAAQATASYLTALKNAPENEKQRALVDTKAQLQDTLKVLGDAASIVPTQSLPLITKLAQQARVAGATDVAAQAQKILDTNSAVKAAAENAQSIGKVYFIAPEGLTDTMLVRLADRIRARFPLADIQPVVHPPKLMSAGVEVVYYRDLATDKEIASNLGKVVSDYLRDQKIEVKSIGVRKASTEQAPAPFQFDIHIGPNIAADLVAATNPVPRPNESSAH
jgi:hypothetical protein